MSAWWNRAVRAIGRNEVSRAPFSLAVAALLTAGVSAQMPEEDKLLPADGAAFDNFGHTADVDGDTAVIGATRHTHTLFWSGAVWVFERAAGGDWSEAAKLVASDAEISDQLGWSVAIDGTRIAAGAPGGDECGSSCVDSGSAYTFVYNGTAWVEEAKLGPIGASGGEKMGHSIALDGDVLVAGAPDADKLGADTGTVYVFERQAGVWSQVQELHPNDVSLGQRFGDSLAIHDDLLLVGASGDSGATGAAYVFARVNGTWVQEAKLTAADGVPGDLFSFGLAVEGDTAVIGANGDDDVGTGSGSAYAFVRVSPGTWSQVQKLNAADGNAGAAFGARVSLSGDSLLVASPGDDDQGATSGSAFVFRRGAGVWSQKLKLLASDGAAVDRFGQSAAIDGDRVIIGADADDDLGSASGSAYAFRLPAFPASYCTAKPNSLGCVPAIACSGWPSASATSGFEVFALDVRNSKLGLLVYGVNGKASTPFQGGILCVAAPLGLTPLVVSGGSPPPAADCTGVYSIDMNAFASGMLGGNPMPELGTPGTIVDSQWWGRDNGAAFGTTLTDGLEYTVQP